MLRSLLAISWRTILLWSLMFWQGGFLFYASAVVPTAQDVIGHRQQGFITRRVTVWMNGAAVVCLGLIAIEMAACADPQPLRRRIAWGLWLGIVLCQAALFGLHPRLDALLDPAEFAVESGFRPLHRTYLWAHTVQWALAVMLTGFLVSSWRTRDRQT